jgi:hypothetical protein
MYPKLNCTTNIEKYHFSYFLMDFMGCLHISRNKTNNKGKIRRSIGGRKLDSRLEGRRHWFTIIHVKATKKVTIILRLGKKNSFIGLQNLEAKEIVQKA